MAATSSRVQIPVPPPRAILDIANRADERYSGSMSSPNEHIDIWTPPELESDEVPDLSEPLNIAAFFQPKIIQVIDYEKQEQLGKEALMQINANSKPVGPRFVSVASEFMYMRRPDDSIVSIVGQIGVVGVLRKLSFLQVNYHRDDVDVTAQGIALSIDALGYFGTTDILLSELQPARVATPINKVLYVERHTA